MSTFHHEFPDCRRQFAEWVAEVAAKGAVPDAPGSGVPRDAGASELRRRAGDAYAAYRRLTEAAMVEEGREEGREPGWPVISGVRITEDRFAHLGEGERVELGQKSVTPHAHPPSHAGEAVQAAYREGRGVGYRAGVEAMAAAVREVADEVMRRGVDAGVVVDDNMVRDAWMGGTAEEEAAWEQWVRERGQEAREAGEKEQWRPMTADEARAWVAREEREREQEAGEASE